MDRRELLKQLAFASSAFTADPFTCLTQPKPLNGNTVTNAVFLNQLGYLPHATKVATFATQLKSPGILLQTSDDNTFRIRSLDSGHLAHEGVLRRSAIDAASGDLTTAADFSALQQQGKYILESARLPGGSDPFEIRPDIYADALRLTMRAYYGQRCGCHVDLGNGYTHPACHLDAAYHPSSGKQGKLANRGGWHDAGDYGRYIVNCGITCGTLLWAWEMYPRTLREVRLGILESGGKTPDYLAEIRWNLDWMLTLQDEDGGVWHKQTSEQFCAFIMPQDDHLISYVIGTGALPYKSTAATVDFSAVMAIAARCYGPYDDAFADRCLAAAKRAYAWAAKYPEVPFSNPKGVGTGGYGDAHLSDELLWAASELFRTTKAPEYEAAFLAGFAKLANPLIIKAPSWGDVTSMALWSYALTSDVKSVQTQEQIKKATQTAAAILIDRGDSNGYGNTLALEDYRWGSNSDAGNQSLLLFIANQFQSNSEAIEAALGNLHYILGRNCHGVSWVTQLGVRPFMHPHHRPSAADGIVAPWPGMLSGGPNARPSDPATLNFPKLPPMRMWIDDQRAYSMNEIAINWNAPLVFLLAAANDISL